MNSNIPKLRYKGYSSYSYSSIDKEFVFFNGKAYEQDMDKNGDYEIISLNSINIEGQLNKNLNKLNTKDKKLESGDLVMILSDVAHGYFLGVTAIILENNKYVLNQRVGGLRAIKNYNSSFLRYYINANQKYFKNIGQGTSQKNINKPDILSFKIPNIDTDEQIKIAKLLGKIDILINEKNTELIVHKEIKNYILKKILV